MKKSKSRALTAIAVLVVLAVIAAAAMKIDLFERKNTVRDEPVPDWVDVQLIDIDGASRRGVKLDAIVVDPPRKGVSRDVIDAMLRMSEIPALPRSRTETISITPTARSARILL